MPTDTMVPLRVPAAPPAPDAPPVPSAPATGPSRLVARLFRGAAWSVLSTVVGKGAVMVLTALAAGALSVLDFARFGLALGAVGVAQALATLSMGSAATRAIAAHRRDDPARAWRVARAALWSTGVTASLGALGVLGWLLVSGRGAGVGSTGVLAVAAIVLGAVLRGVLGGVVTGFEAWRTVATSNLVAGLALVVGGVTAPSGAGPAWFLGVHAGSQAAAVLVLGHSARGALRDLPVPASDRRVDAATWRGLWSFTLPTFVLGAVPAVAYFIGQHWLEGADPSGMALAVFVIAWQLGNLVLLVPSVVSRSFLPVVAGLRSPDSPAAALRLVARLTAPGALIAMVIALPLLVAPERVLAVYAPDYATASAGETVRWLAGWAVVAAATRGVEFVAVGRGAVRFALLARLAWFGVLLVLLFTGVVASVRGVAAAHLIASLLQAALLVVGLLRGGLTRRIDP